MGTCMSVHRVCACCLQTSEEGVGSPSTAATDGCELHVGAGSQTWVLYKVSWCSEQLSHLSSPQYSLFSLIFLGGSSFLRTGVSAVSHMAAWPGHLECSAVSLASFTSRSKLFPITKSSNCVNRISGYYQFPSREAHSWLTASVPDLRRYQSLIMLGRMLDGTSGLISNVCQKRRRETVSVVGWNESVICRRKGSDLAWLLNSCGLPVSMLDPDPC